MDAREALVRIRDLHRAIPNDNDELICAACSPPDDNFLAVDFPCDTRRICDEVLSPGEYITADPWPSVPPGEPA